MTPAISRMPATSEPVDGSGFGTDVAGVAGVGVTSEPVDGSVTCGVVADVVGGCGVIGDGSRGSTTID